MFVAFLLRCRACGVEFPGTAVRRNGDQERGFRCPGCQAFLVGGIVVDEALLKYCGATSEIALSEVSEAKAPLPIDVPARSGIHYHCTQPLSQKLVDDAEPVVAGFRIFPDTLADPGCG